MTKTAKIKAAAVLILLVALFVISSYYSSKYSDVLKSFVLLKGAVGALSYVFLLVIAIVVVPIEVLPAMPIAVNIWGANQAAWLSVAGWTAGSLAAFLLARRFGRKFVCRFIKQCDLDEWGSALPKRHLFWIIVVARVILPVDIISYAVGLFTRMAWYEFAGATLLGVIPFAFIFAYGSRLPPSIQIIAGMVLIVALFAGYKDLMLKIFRKYRN